MFLSPRPAMSESLSAKPVYDSSGLASAGAIGPTIGITYLSNRTNAPASAASSRAPFTSFFGIGGCAVSLPYQAKVLYSAFKQLNI